ncbi:MAG: hypothetical protein D6681_22905 [Calditrichaeota bacterium]|nr:MAG: hypothetical protein D6681_22905 [Calditrichota bacterium]
MTRPSVIVGVGGTGQWVLTWLKRDLVTREGSLPPNVRLLSIDTTRQLEAETRQVATVGEEERARIGDVILEDHEFIHLGGDAYSFAEKIQQGDRDYAHVAQWFHGKHWREALTPNAFILDTGAGRIRQLGRLAVFKEMIEEGGRHLETALETFLLEVQKEVTEQRKLEIIVVGSLAGGTGSGIFLDIALLLRLLAKKHVSHHVLKGVFALPWAFTPSPNDEMLARSFAAWRELNRFMVVSEDFPMPEITYRSDRSIQPSTRLFDACYLVDGRDKATRKTVGQEAKYGVDPLMAEVISAFLDEQAGKTYEDFILTNLNPFYVRNRGIPLYSTIGARVLKIPAQYVQESSALNFGKEALLKILVPETPPQEDGGWIAQGAMRHLKLASVNKNQEDKGFSGRERSRDLFLKSVQFEQEQVKPTRFIARLGEILEMVREESKRTELVNTLARAGGGKARGGSLTGWAGYFTALGDDPQVQAVRQEVQEFMRFNLLENYGRREGQGADEVRRNFQKIPEDVRKRFGSDLVESEKGEEFLGEFWNALERVSGVQLTAFKAMLRLTLARTLNGISEDPLVARTGKLGYAWDFMDGVVHDLADLRILLDDVRKRREEIRPELRLADLLERARRFLQETKGKKFLLFWEHPDARRAEQEYLLVYQRLVDLRREDLMHRMVQETIQQFYDIAVEARDRLRNWILHLTTGDDASGVKGLWDQIVARENELREAISFDRRYAAQKLVEEALQEPREEDLRALFASLRWEVTYEGGHINVQIHLDGQEKKLSDPMSEEQLSWRRESSLENFQHFSQKTSEMYRGHAERTRIADYLKRKYGRSTQAVEAMVQAEDLANVETLSVYTGSPAKRSTHVRVQTEENDPFFHGAEGLEGKLREREHLPLGQTNDEHVIQVVGSEDPYRLAVIRTDDLIKYDKFNAWDECARAYQKHFETQDYLDPILLHNFAAESKAAEIELRMVKEENEYRALDPRVVMLLENVEGLRQFFWLMLLDKVRETGVDETPYRWELLLEDRDANGAIWITRPYDRDNAVDKERGRPQLLDAFHGYVIHGQTFQPGKTTRVDHRKVDRLLRDAWKDLGLEGRVELIRTHLDCRNQEGLIYQLRAKSLKPDYQYRIPEKPTFAALQKEEAFDGDKQVYWDLSVVAEILLSDQLDELERDLARKK